MVIWESGGEGERERKGEEKGRERERKGRERYIIYMPERLKKIGNVCYKSTCGLKD